MLNIDFQQHFNNAYNIGMCVLKNLCTFTLLNEEMLIESDVGVRRKSRVDTDDL